MATEKKPRTTNKNVVAATKDNQKKWDPVSNGQDVWKPSEEALKQERPLRIFAWIAWLLAIAGELFTIFYTLKQNPINMVLLIGALVLIALLAIAGSRLWRKANELNPASSKDGVRFFIQNQLGAIMSMIAFLPLIVLIFLNKNMDGKQKTLAGGVGIALVVIASLLGMNFTPPSVEQNTYTMVQTTQTAVAEYNATQVASIKQTLTVMPPAEQTAYVEQLKATMQVTPAAPASPEEVANLMQYTGVDKVYWKTGGKVYHLCAEASALQRESSVDDNIYFGTVADAHAAGKDRLTLEVNAELKQCGLTSAPTPTPVK
ncbi:MAG: hypothetical protein VB108_06820 [Anaerolineaceae bacterium]|nr:hypothetical protein [Anaerolineaceae bacterium]